MKANVAIGMSRYGTGEDAQIRLEIEDKASGVRFLELSISLNNFALFMTNVHGVDAEAELRGLDLIGMVHEYKCIDIDTPPNMPYIEKDNPEIAAALLAPYEVDGWKGNAADLFNNHLREFRDERSLRIPYQKVFFTRYVKPDNAKDNQ